MARAYFQLSKAALRDLGVAVVSWAHATPLDPFLADV